MTDTTSTQRLTVKSLKEYVDNTFAESSAVEQAFLEIAQYHQKLTTYVENLENLLSNLMLGYADIAVLVEVLLEKALEDLSEEDKLALQTDLSSRRTDLLSIIQKVSRGELDPNDAQVSAKLSERLAKESSPSDS